MNDIEVLEEKIKSIKKYDTYRYDWTETDIQMVENLLKEKQSDKERIKRYEKYLENKDKKFKEALEYEFQERETKYIPKSLIKEKIEEYKEELERDKICIDFAIEYEKDIKLIAKIQVLEELLKGE